MTSTGCATAGCNCCSTACAPPSTLGTFLRSFTHRHNRQQHAVHRRFLANLATATDLLPGAAEMTYVDIDPSHVRVYGSKKQGAEYGRLKGKRTLHPLLC